MSKNKMEGKCAYCGENFIKNHFNEKYCSEKCKKNSRREQNRRNFHKWYHRHKNDMGYDKRWGMGSGKLGPHMHKDQEKEKQVIQKEFVRLGLKKWR